MTESKTHVAVVDDDQSFSRALGRMLRAAGFETVVFGSAEAFLGDSADPHFDCVVLDIHLGGMSGLELRRKMLALGWNSPVIFVTANDEPEIGAEAQKVGCHAYFRKPVQGKLLAEAINTAVKAAQA